MRRLCSLLLGLVLAWLPLAGPTPMAVGAAADWAVPQGRFYTQTGTSDRGFAVTDRDGVPFWSAVRRAGGIEATGYPISHRFTLGGFTSQAFQKVIMQWQPGRGEVAYLNVFDLLHERGQDAWLRRVQSVPEPLAVDERGKSWDQIVRDRLAWLDTNPAIRARYLAAADPIAEFGLPTSPVMDFGGVQVVRLQRAVIQQWLVATPWAAAGQVTVANGGDVAKEAGLIPADVITPDLAPAPPPSAARAQVNAAPALNEALDALDQTRAGRPLIEILAASGAPVRLGLLPARARAGYLPAQRMIVVNRNDLTWASPESLAAVIGHEAVHLRDDLDGTYDGSPWQCYQSELRAFTTAAEIWREIYPNGKPLPENSLEEELNLLLDWSLTGTNLDRLYSLGDRYDDQCG